MSYISITKSKTRRPHQLDWFQGVGGDDVELDPVAVLDSQHRRLAGVPGEGDDQGVAGADRGDAGEEDAEDAGGDRGEGDRPEAGEGDPGRALIGQLVGGPGAGEGV